MTFEDLSRFTIRVTFFDEFYEKEIPVAEFEIKADNYRTAMSLGVRMFPGYVIQAFENE